MIVINLKLEEVIPILDGKIDKLTEIYSSIINRYGDVDAFGALSDFYNETISHY